MHMHGCRLHEQSNDTFIVMGIELPERKPPRTQGRIRKIGETNHAFATTPDIHGSRLLVVLIKLEERVNFHLKSIEFATS